MKTDALKKLEIRLFSVMTELETNWDGLAERLGVTRTFITSVRKGVRNLGPDPLKKLNELEKETGLLFNKNTLEVKEDQAAHVTVGCRQCDVKDQEIRRLVNMVTAYEKNLESSQRNLSQALDLLQAKNEGPANLASGASGGGSVRRNKSEKGKAS